MYALMNLLGVLSKAKPRAEHGVFAFATPQVVLWAYIEMKHMALDLKQSVKESVRETINEEHKYNKKKSSERTHGRP